MRHMQQVTAPARVTWSAQAQAGHRSATGNCDDQLFICGLPRRNLQSPVATQHVLVLYFSVRHHLRLGGPHFHAYEHWFAALVHTGGAEWLVPLKRNSDFDTTTDFASIEEACAHVARCSRHSTRRDRASCSEHRSLLRRTTAAIACWKASV